MVGFIAPMKKPSTCCMLSMAAPCLGAGASAVHARNLTDHHCGECLSSGDRAERIFPACRTMARLVGGIRASQDISFQAMKSMSSRFVNIIKSDPAVETAVIYTGGNGPVNGGFVSIQLKPLAERKLNSSQVIDRLRPKLNSVPGGRVVLAASQDLRIGGQVIQRAISVHASKRKRG